MKIQNRVRYRVSNKLQVRVGSGTGRRKTLPEITCITGEVIRRHKSLEYMSTKTSNFQRPQNSLAFVAFDELSINQYSLWL